MKSIDVSSLSKLNNPKIIDIRDNYKYNLGNIPNSVNIPYLFLITNPREYLNKNDTYYILCESGNTSLRCVLELLELGYDVVNIEGGYNSYLKNKNNI